MIATDPIAETEPWFSVALVPVREEVRLQAIGELDLAAGPALQEQVDDLLTTGSRQLVIDLRRLTFIDLTGVRLLLKLAQDAGDNGWRLSIVGAGGQVRQMLMLTRTLDRLPLQPAVQLPALAEA